MLNIAIDRAEEVVGGSTGADDEEEKVDSPFPVLPEVFYAYQCLHCGIKSGGWIDCVQHMMHCCPNLYEFGKMWGGTEAVRRRCGVDFGPEVIQ